MAAANQFDTFIGYVNSGAINWGGDVWKLALTSVAPTASDALLADLTEIDYTNLSARTVTISDASVTGDVFTATADALTLTASGLVEGWRYIVLYNDTAAGDPLCAWWDYGSLLVMTGGSSFDWGTAATFPVWIDEPAP